MNAALRHTLLLLSLVLSLAGCQSLGEREEALKLNDTLDSYGAAARWQPLAGLYGFLQPELQPAAPPDGLDNLRVTGYEVVSPPRKLAEDRVVQTVVIEYVQVDRQVVRRLMDRQVWQRTADKQWLRANPIPAFK